MRCLFSRNNKSCAERSLRNSVVGVGSVGAWVASVAWVRGFVGGVGQILALVVWVAWVHKILARVKKSGVG